MCFYVFVMFFFLPLASEAVAVGFGVGKASCPRIWGACGQGQGRGGGVGGEGRGKGGRGEGRGGGGREVDWTEGVMGVRVSDRGSEGSTCARHDPFSALTTSTHIYVQ
jgi:hypothetical protein